MTQNDMIEFLVRNLECNECPLYVQCRRDQPRTCGEYLNKLFQARTAAAEQAVKSHVARIRRKHVQMMKETDAARRRTLRSELTELKRQLREVKEYIR